MEQTQKQESGEKKSLRDILYYYKWYILIGVAVVIFLLYVLISGLTHSVPDANMLYIGPKALAQDQLDYLYDTMQAKVIKADYNGNGRIEADLIQLHPKVAGKDEWGEIAYDPGFYAEYEHELNAGDTVIFIVESEDLYERMMMDDLLVPLEEIFGKTPESAADAFSFKMGDLDISKLDAFKVFSKSARLCVRHLRIVNGTTTEQAKELQEYNLKVFSDLIDYRFFVSDQM